MNKTHISKSRYRLGGALHALALMGAGATVAGVAAVPAVAQDYTNVTASGRVTADSGENIAGATVSITSNEQGFNRTVTTDSSGAYRVPQIPAGSYTFTITADGYEQFVDTAVTLSPDGAGNQFILIPAGSAQASTGDIVVTGRRVQVVDFERTTTGAVIDIGELSERVPVARSLRDIVLLSPGTSQGGSSQNARFANQAQIGGSAFSENAYYVNGLNVTEFRQGFSPSDVPFDFYETVEVKSGGFQAEFGRATGGVVNAVTKSGSNEYKASVLVNVEPDWLRQDQENTYTADNDGDTSSRVDTVVTLSGPIIKDRLFFFGLYNHRNVEVFNGRADAEDAADNTGTRQKSTSPFYAFKIDAVPFDNHRLEFTYFNSERETLIRQFDYNSDTNAIGRETGRTLSQQGGENYVARYTGQFSDWLTLSAAYGKNKNRDTTLPNDLASPRVLDVRTGISSPLPGTNPSGSFQVNEDERTFYRGDIDLYVQLLGSHHFRLGYDREELTSLQTSTPTGDGFYELFRAGGSSDQTNLPAGTEYFTRRFFVNGGSFDSINEAFYIQDNWTLFDDRLNLQLGVRNDRFVNKSADGTPFYESGDQWGPRLGFSFDAFGDKRTKVYGSFGRYFLPIPSNTNIRLAGAELDYRSYFQLAGIVDGVPQAGAPVLTVNNARPCPDTDVQNCTITGDGSAADPSTVISQNLKPQSLDEYIIGAEHRFEGGIRVGAYYTHRSLNESLEDSAIDLAVRDYCVNVAGIPATPGRTGGCEDIWIGFHQYVLNNPGEPLTVILDTPLPGETELRTLTFTPDQLGYPRARRTYDAVTVEFERPFDGTWSLQGSYTWAQLKGNIEGGVKSDISQVDSGLTQDFDTPGLTVGSYGFLPGHRRHTFKLFGSYQFTDWFTLGGNAVVQSPRKFGCIGVVPSSVDPVAALYENAGNFCQGELVPRGTAFESDWRKELNLSFVFSMPVDFDATMRVDVFNVFNSQSALDFDEFGDTPGGDVNPTYQFPLTYQDARSVRLQFRVGF